MSLLNKLKRIALDRQGLLRSEHFGRGKGAVLRAVEQLGYVQIDTISVVARAHHHVLWSRIGNYQPVFLQRLVGERKLFEYWFHAAAWLPMRDYRYALPRMRKMNGERDWFPDSNKKLQREILHRVAAEGPLRARDFEDPAHKSDGWWEWKPAKQALEQLFMQGELMVSGREGFQKIYDLPERVLPGWVDTRVPDLDEYARHLVDTSLRAHGFASLKSMAYLRKGKALRAAIRSEIENRVADRLLLCVEIRDGAEIYIDPELLESRAPRTAAQVRILSPFDNSLIQRERARLLFGFDYQIECYLPSEKRKYGYFCLPLLYRDGFAGRVDCKAHRESGMFEVKSLHVESRVDDGFAAALADALQDFAGFNGCDRIQLNETSPPEWMSRLKAQLPV